MDKQLLLSPIHGSRLGCGYDGRCQASAVGQNQDRCHDGKVPPRPPRTRRREVGADDQVLGLDVADVYALAGYTRPSQLPTFTPYLRSKFADMPAEARSELEQSFRFLADKYGFDADGPASGEDEN